MLKKSTFWNSVFYFFILSKMLTKIWEVKVERFSIKNDVLNSIIDLEFSEWKWTIRISNENWIIQHCFLAVPIINNTKSDFIEFLKKCNSEYISNKIYLSSLQNEWKKLSTLKLRLMREVLDLFLEGLKFSY